MTQYPQESTKEDFWRMVWDRNSPVIIVLQSEDEEVRVQLLESLLTATLTTRQLVLMLGQWGASPLRFNGLKIDSFFSSSFLSMSFSAMCVCECSAVCPSMHVCVCVCVSASVMCVCVCMHVCGCVF